MAEGSDELYQKAIRKYVQQVAHDYLGGGNAHLYGANKFDADMFGVRQEQAKQDFKTLFPQALKQLQGVAEARMSASQRLWNAEQKQRAKSDASLARTPSSIPKPEPKKDEKTNEEGGVGVIATKKQAKDPRYSMSLTKDVRPGQVEKNLKAFDLAEKMMPASMFAGSKKNKLGPAGQWKNTGPKKNKPAQAGDLVGGMEEGQHFTNCVPVSEDVENIMDTLINKIIVNEAISKSNK